MPVFLHCFCVNAIGVIIIEYQQLSITLAGWEYEVAGLISESLAGAFNAGGTKDKVAAECVLRWWFVQESRQASRDCRRL
jgi:hypothetical protein